MARNLGVQPEAIVKGEFEGHNAEAINKNFETIFRRIRKLNNDSGYDADIITSGLLALDRGGTHADLSQTGGASHVLKQSAAGADITVGTLTAADIGITPSQILKVPLYRKWFSWTYVGTDAQGVAQGINMANGTILASSRTDASTATFFGTRLTSGATIGNAASITAAAGVDPVITLLDPVFILRMKTGASLTALRYWFGLFSGAVTTADTLALSHVSFRYSTVAADGGWVGVCCDGTAVNTQVTATVAAIAVDTEYWLKIRVANNGTEVHYSVKTGSGDYSAEQTLNTNMPATTTRLGFNLLVFTTAGVAKSWVINNAYCEMEDGA